MKIFWSWQSDHPGNISRVFVREALERTVDSLNEDLAIEEPEREVTLDHDRKGVPGSPDLANIILEKIRGSDVFVADVTPVGATESSRAKKLMNSNVAIELGYALHSISDRRLIMIMNTAFGSRADLPFDLQHKAGPLSYELPIGATRAEIQQAKKQLVGVLKVALREMLPTLGSLAEPFTSIAARSDDPSRYFAPGQILVERTRSRFSTETQQFTSPKTPLLYLRVMPTKPIQPLKRAEACELIRQEPLRLRPFCYPPQGASSEANEFGAIAFDANYEKGEILSAAQLFLNREIWAFDSVCLSPEWASRDGPNGIPTQLVEQTFAVMLREYIKFMNDKLGVPPPYRIEGGAANIKGYVIFMPSKYIRRSWGPILQAHVSWSGTLSSLDANAADAVLLEIFEAIFDAGAEVRPKGLYGFPGEVPGAVPN